jgi:hypothetical protein
MSKDEVRAMYRSAFIFGWGWDRDSEPTVEEMNEAFERDYRRSQESKKDKPKGYIAPPPDAVPLPFDEK